MKYFFLLFLFPIQILCAADFTLKGTVTDLSTGEPIKDALITISNNKTVFTNSKGYYYADGFPEGSYQVKVSQLGYISLSEDILINADTEKNFSLQPSPVELYEVVVSTNRFDKYMRSSPYSELYISHAQIENKPFQSLPDVLKNEPGLSLLSDGVWGKEISIRGLSRENIVTLVDGSRIATSTDIAARLSLVDLNDIERIEIIKGASSTLYGSGATGGIINIITSSPLPQEKPFVDGRIAMGYNSVNNSTNTSGSLIGGGSFWSSKISGSYRKADNINTPAGVLKNSMFEDYSLSGNLNIMPMENHLLSLNYQLFRADNVGIPGSSIFPDAADVIYPYERRELISGGYEVSNISSFISKVSIKYSHQLIERDVLNKPNAPAAISPDRTRRTKVLKITPHADHNNNNLQLQGNFFLTENNNLAAGIDYWDRSYSGVRERHFYKELLDTLGNVKSVIDSVLGESPLPESQFSSLGFFVQDYFDAIKNKLALSIGGRIDKIKANSELTLNPLYKIINGKRTDLQSKPLWNTSEENDVSYSSNLGIKYTLSTNLDLTLSLGYSFRSPSLEERFQYIDQGNSLRVGNPNLDSETGRSADLGIRYYSSEFTLNTSIFYNYFSNLVVEKSGVFEGRNAFIKTNVGEARLYGFDFIANYNLYRSLVLMASASYVKGDDISINGNLPEIPPLNGSIGLAFGITDFLKAEILSVIFAPQNDIAPNEIKTPGYATFDLSLSTSKVNAGIANVQLTAGIENILDKNYRNHLSTNRGSISIEPGRNIYVKLITNW